MAGSNKAPESDGVFSKAPYFNFNDDKLKFNTNDLDNPNENYNGLENLDSVS